MCKEDFPASLKHYKRCEQMLSAGLTLPPYAIRTLKLHLVQHPFSSSVRTYTHKHTHIDRFLFLSFFFLSLSLAVHSN